MTSVTSIQIQKNKKYKKMPDTILNSSSDTSISSDFDFSSDNSVNFESGFISMDEVGISMFLL